MSYKKCVFDLTAVRLGIQGQERNYHEVRFESLMALWIQHIHCLFISSLKGSYRNESSLKIFISDILQLCLWRFDAENIALASQVVEKTAITAVDFVPEVINEWAAFCMEMILCCQLC